MTQAACNLTASVVITVVLSVFVMDLCHVSILLGFLLDLHIYVEVRIAFS